MEISVLSFFTYMINNYWYFFKLLSQLYVFTSFKLKLNILFLGDSLIASGNRHA